MYGWRAKIGLITPMSENVEHAFHIYAPEGVSFASAKISYPAPDAETLTDRVRQAAAMYRDYEVDLVVFGCTSCDCVMDYEQEQECVRQGVKVDRCVLYVYRCAVYYANTSPDERKPELLKWWNWKD